jgi:hypothetical protein
MLTVNIAGRARVRNAVVATATRRGMLGRTTGTEGLLTVAGSVGVVVGA